MVIPRWQDAIRDEWRDSYEKQRNSLWNHLISFNTNLYTLERLETFPFKLFISFYPNRIFWETTRNALIDMTIMIASRILWDDNSNTLTLLRFHDAIRQNLRDTQAEMYFQDACKKVKFHKRAKGLQEKVKDIRDNYIAHLNREAQLNPDPARLAKVTINLKEMQELLEAVQELFDVLCYNHRHDLTLAGYGRNHTTDIDRLLDDVARASRILNLPETDPDRWRQRLAEISLKELSKLNEYRVKFGLPEVTR